MKTRTNVTYKCKCGMYRSRRLDTSSFACKFCGTPVNIPVIAKYDFNYDRPQSIYSPVFYGDNMPPVGVLDIAAKYRKEISNISIKIGEYYDKMNTAANKLRYDASNEVVNRRNEIVDLKHLLDNAMKEYNTECGNSLITGDTTALGSIIGKINGLKSTISRKESELNAISAKHSNKIAIEINSMPEARVVEKLFSMRDGYTDRIRRDESRYGRYITCIYNMCEKEDPSYFNEFIEQYDRISDEDDEYLKSICRTYKGKDFYMKRAAHIKADYDHEEEMHRMSRARSIKLSADDVISIFPMMDTDPWSAEASRMCFESYVKSIADADGSINGIKF